jgi:hypothetical protein
MGRYSTWEDGSLELGKQGSLLSRMLTRINSSRCQRSLYITGLEMGERRLFILLVEIILDRGTSSRLAHSLSVKNIIIFTSTILKTLLHNYSITELTNIQTSKLSHL